MMQLKESPSDLDLVLSSFSPMSSIDADRELHKSGLWKLKTSLASFF